MPTVALVADGSLNAEALHKIKNEKWKMENGKWKMKVTQICCPPLPFPH